MVGRRPHISNMRLEPVNGARWQRHFSTVRAAQTLLIELLNELPRLGFLQLTLAQTHKPIRLKRPLQSRRLGNFFFVVRMKSDPELVGPHGTEG